jgi:hypothetical protein
MPVFVTPPGFSGTAELTASTGLEVVSQGIWTFSQAGYNDGATFGASLGWPDPQLVGRFSSAAPKLPATPITAGVLSLRAQNWQIPVGSDLSEYTDPATHVTYTAAQCRVVITGQWIVIRQVNSNSYNSFGVERSGLTVTDQGSRSMDPWLLDFVSEPATYVIQGSEVTGGARNTFSDHVWTCEITESATTDNSNYAFQSNTIARPVWAYTYSKSWQVLAMSPLAAAIAQYRQTRS